MTADGGEQVLAALDLDQQVALLSGGGFWRTQEIPGVVPSVVLTDGPHGVRRQLGDADHLGLGSAAPATCFPTAAALGSTWDPDLLEEVGRALGREARAADVAVLLGPGMNLKRHPRGGRNFEYLSEDPHVSGMLAAALVRGIQAEGVAACPKHFAVNSQETRRMVVDAIVDERTLRELYLHAFELVVRTAAPRTIMTAYNRVNGPWCSDHQWLLAQVLRGEWGFDGMVVSDWGGTNDRVAGVTAGLDLEMPGGTGSFDREVIGAVRSGGLDRAAVQRAAGRVAELALSWQDVDTDVAVDHDAHHALARRVAAAGTVLLSNDGLLPLDPNRSTAVIGAFATRPRYQGAGSSKVEPTRLDTLLGALREPMPCATHSAGYVAATGATTPALLADAVRTAEVAEQVVLLVGLPDAAESEGLDRPHCRLPEGQEVLLAAVLDANPRTVVVVVGGGVVELPWADRAAAVVAPWLGGQAGGAALAEVLLGRLEPGGRLAESIPVSVEDLPASASFPGDGRQVVHRERFLVGYRFHDTAGVPAHFPFGHGLGYTTWAWGEASIDGSGTDLTVTVELTNTGDRPGSQVVQVYVGRPDSVVPRPTKELRGFARLRLDPGETATAEVVLDRRAFAVWDIATGAWLVEGGPHQVLVGASSADIRSRLQVDVPSTDALTPVPATAGPVATDEELAALLGRPVPDPDPVRPLSRTSTLAELEATAAGRMLLRALRAAMAGRVDSDGFGDDAMEQFMEGMPLRALAQFGLVPSMAVVDRLVAAVDGRPLAMVRPRRR